MKSPTAKKLACITLLTPIVACGAVDAEERFAQSFSGSQIFDCRAGAKRIRIGVGASLPPGVATPKKFGSAELNQLLNVGVEVLPTKPINRIDRWWGVATFTNNDQKVTTSDGRGNIMRFERFGPTPIWPFKKDNQVFFNFRIGEDEIYKCRAIYQPDQ